MGSSHHSPGNPQPLQPCICFLFEFQREKQCWGLNCVPQKTHAQFLTPGDNKPDISGNQMVVDVIKWWWGRTTLAWVLNLIWPVSLQEEITFYHRKKTHKENAMQQERQWLKFSAHKLKGMRDSGPLPDAKRNKTISSVSGGIRSCRHLDLGFQNKFWLH